MSAASMHRRSTTATWVPFFGIAAAVVAAWMLVIHRGTLDTRPALLAGGVAMDLLGTVTLAYWWLVVRGGRASPRSIVTVIALACVAARVILPSDVAERFGIVRFVLAAGEVVLIGWAIARLRRTRAHGDATTARDVDDDLAVRIEAVCKAIAPNPVVARVAATEMATMAYAFARRSRAEIAPGRFAVAPALVPAMLWALVGVAAIEIVPLHLFITRWSTRAAWVVTAIGIYSVIWLIGHFRAVTMRRCEVAPDGVTIRVGLRCEAVIAPANVASVTLLDWKAAGALAKAVYQPGRPQPSNVLVTLRAPARITAVLGMTKTVESLALRLEDPAGFVAAVEAVAPAEAGH